MELIVVVAIIGVVAAIAIPVTLTQRQTAVDSAQRSSLTVASNAIANQITSWRGSPPAQLTVSTSGGNWLVNGPADSNNVSVTYVTGQTTSDTINLTGTVWTDGSYCLKSASTASPTTFLYRSDTQAITQNSNCPTSGFAGGSKLPADATSAANLPGQVTGLSVTGAGNNTVTASWASVSGATGYTIKVTGSAPVKITTTTATVSNVPVGTATVTVYATNASGAGPAASTTATVTGSSNVAAYTPLSTPTWMSLPLITNWTGYVQMNPSGNGGNYAPAQYTKAGGIVQLRGLIQSPVATAAGTVIATLPDGYRPDYTSLFPAMIGGNAASYISIDQLGNVTIPVALAANTWFSLENVLFPAAGVANWTSVGASGSGSAFANGWTSYGASTYGPPRFWQDADGFTWLGGVVSSGTAVDNTNIFTLPAPARAFKEQHYVAASNGGFGGVGARPGDGVNFKNGSNAWMSLAGVFINTATSQANLSWTIPYYSGTFAAYNATSFPAPGYTQTSYGLVVLQGLGNCVVGNQYYLPTSMTTNFNNLRIVNSGLAIGRLNENQGGGIDTGVCTSWFSNDSVGFFPN